MRITGIVSHAAPRHLDGRGGGGGAVGLHARLLALEP
eukprot:COSAG02_NODE_6060_length_3833_cov_12.625603_6_plen_36_part_01